MLALLLDQCGPIRPDATSLRIAEVLIPSPAAGEVLLEVRACGVCHTELDEIEGRLRPPQLPVILGHQVVGRVAQLGVSVDQWKLGDRAGLAWIYSACGRCEYCLTDRENLCPDFQGTGRDRDGGYAEFVVAPADFLIRIPDAFTDVEAAPLLCAGAIGFRSLRLTNLQDGQRLGLTGFGASAQLVLKMAQARFPSAQTFVFARSPQERELALERGAVWAGETVDTAPDLLHAIIDTTPAWVPIVAALENLAPGGRLVVNAIRKEDADQSALLSLHYAKHLWLEKEIKSVANVTRRDVQEFVTLAAKMELQPLVQEYPLAEANRALVDLKTGPVLGAKVLVCRS
jgi:propanol-preferring alcohol dehydrogenase